MLTLAACQSNPMIKKLEIKEMKAIAELASGEITEESMKFAATLMS